MTFRLLELFSLLKSHPLIACSFLLLFTPPIFRVVVFFSPLIISTALCGLAVLSFGPHFGDTPTAASTEPDKSANSAAAEEKLKNLDMACKEEVTWLEWLHNEHSKELLDHEQEFSMALPWEANNAEGASSEVVRASAIALAKKENMPSPAKILPSPEKAASSNYGEANEVKHIDEEEKEQKEVKQIDAHDQEYEEVRGIYEEEQSSVRFSFFQNNNLAAAPAEHEVEKYDRDDVGILSTDAGDDDKVSSHGGIVPVDVGDDDKAGSQGGILPVSVGSRAN